MSECALELRGLRRSFGRVVVNALDLTVPTGQLFALLGPNAAGKTTTLRMIAGLLRPDAGEIFICGHNLRTDPLAAKQVSAWVADEPLLYDKLSVLENLEFVAGLWGMAPRVAAFRAQTLLERLGIWDQRDERCLGLSRGERQKAMLAGALLHEPRRLLLDEPFTGLDAAAVADVKVLLHERIEAGASIILTTHSLDVAERIADRIGIIINGQMREIGTLDELRAHHANHKSLEAIFLTLVGHRA